MPSRRDARARSTVPVSHSLTQSPPRAKRCEGTMRRAAPSPLPSEARRAAAALVSLRARVFRACSRARVASRKRARALRLSTAGGRWQCRRAVLALDGRRRARWRGSKREVARYARRLRRRRRRHKPRRASWSRDERELCRRRGRAACRTRSVASARRRARDRRLELLVLRRSSRNHAGQRRGIHASARESHTPVEMRARHSAGGTDESDSLSALHRSARLDVDSR